MRMKNVVESLFPLIRRLVLGELVRSEGENVHIHELARRVGKEAKSVYNELKNLEAVGIVSSRRMGNQVHYSLNPKCPIYPELKMLILKTVGLADVLREALKPLATKIKVAFIYGSFARGEERVDSDVDVMVIGDVSFGEVVSALVPAQEQLQREVNPTVYPPAEFREKLASGKHFLTAVMGAEKIFLVGDERELEQLGGRR